MDLAVASGRMLKPMMIALDAMPGETSDFVDGAYAAVNHLHHNLLVGELGKTLLYSLHGALHVSLTIIGSSFTLTGLNLAEQVIQRQLLPLYPLSVCSFLLQINVSAKFLASFSIFSSHKYLTGIRHIVEAQDFHWRGWSCFLHAAAPVVHHGTNLAEACAGRNGLSHS